MEDPIVADQPADILTEARRAIEAMLLVASEPTEEHLLAQVVELPPETVRGICVDLAAAYEADRRGFQLVEVAGGWRYQTHPDVHPYVERYAMEGLPNRLSSAALETLAIVAYKQPISRIQVGAIRGVNADGVLKTLEQRGYIAEVGRDNGPGQATLFGTTDFFLERLELAAIDDLPPLGDFIPSADVLEAMEQTLRIESEPAGNGDGDNDSDNDGDAESQGVVTDDDTADAADEILDLREQQGTPDDRYS
ncbi:MAG: SMC-Scp complex subunit ScpB [Acidimicrobiia bacterium]|nr:SMC-Scp complex subunit ScpB [Acidimicrobiia bacterium]